MNFYRVKIKIWKNFEKKAFFACCSTCNVLILFQIISACSMSSEIHHLHLKFAFFLWLSFNGEWTFGESNKFRNKAVSIYLALMIFNFIPQIRQSEARCWTWISIRLIKLFWPWKEKRQRLVMTRLCEKPGRGKRTCFGPRNSKIVHQNSRLSTIPTHNVIQVNRYENRGKISRTS